LWLTAILPTNALALGLGEIEVKSFLNQPLEAEIPVISARPGEIDDLLVSLASREAFSRAGLARPRNLLDLRFSVRKNEAGDEAVIVVSTKDGVKEPFLNFLIEADWAKGRVLREFTVLLDPPFYADQPPPVEPASQQAAAPISDESSVSDIVEQTGVTSTMESESAESAETGEQLSEPIALSDDGSGNEIATPEPVAQPEPEPIADSSSYQYTPSSSQTGLDQEVYVNKGDTLWSIAKLYKDDRHSMSQVMLAFQRANPDAFNDGNINNMKEGAILRAPDAAELDAMGEQEAYAEVLVQNGLWDEYVARVTGVSTTAAVDQGESAESTESAGGETADTGESGGELSLLLPADGGGDSAGTGDGAEVEELRTKLAMAEEELEASRIENRELESRISDLQARLSKVEELQKMVEIEDDSLARLQADQSAQQPEAGASEGGEPVEEPPAEAGNGKVESSEDALIEELLAEEAAAQAEEEAAKAPAASDDGMVSDEGTAGGMVEDEAAGQAPAAEMGSTEGMAADEGEEAATGGQSDDQGQAAQQTTPPAPVIVTEQTKREPSFLDGILPAGAADMIPSMPSMGGIFSDPITLAALGGVVLLLVALLVIKRKKNSSDSESTITASGDEDLFADDEEELTPIHLADVELPEDTDIKTPSDEDIPSADELDTMTSTAEVTAEVPPEAEDDFAQTSIISATDMPEPEAPAPAAAAEPAEQDDVLNEVDVYLAYGLYDNAEELLNSSLTDNPDRADYRSKLLDTYFATKNESAFVKEAEKLKSMGDAATRYWDRVQIMGYELAPDNPLFSEAKDSDLSAADLEIAKPQEADFDLGADDDDTSFSTTDFDLGADDTGGDFNEDESGGDDDSLPPTQVIQQVDELPELGEEEVAATQVVQQVGDFPDLGEDDETNLNQRAEEPEDSGLDLPDDIGDELEFSIDDEDTVGAGESADQADDELDMAMDFDLDDGTTDDDPSDFDLGEDLGFADDDDGGDEIEDSIELEVPEEDGADDFLEATAVVSSDELEASLLGGDDSESDDDEGIDLGMDDTGIMDLNDPSLDTGELQLPTDDDGDIDDDEDVSILDFGADDFEEPTALVESAGDDDSLSIDVDMEDDDEEARTGTFAPGDFDEPTAVADAADLDDIDDLMLPDDVDEVSTKLDLARAFIDMGDTEGARGSLEEVIAEGNDAQKEEAQALLEQI
jgi:pilus assembly protein FimV